MKRKRVMQSVERDKTWAEKMKLATCRCGHTNTVHAGGLWDCAFEHCPCGEFRERLAGEPRQPRSAFQGVQQIMAEPTA